MGFNTKMFGRLMQIHSKKNHNTWIAPTAGDSTGTFPTLDHCWVEKASGFRPPMPR